MRYYSILRPISIGAYPKPKDNEVLKINNFDIRSYCKDIDREAWGFIDYEKPLSLDDVADYELAPECCCGNCTWFNGGIGDGRQFCDEKEIEVGEDGYCYRHSRKAAE